MKVKNSQVEERIARMRKAGYNVGLDRAYGNFRVETSGGNRSLSPRVSNRQIMDWLDAYEEGWRAAFAALREEAQGYIDNGEVHSFAADLVERLANGS